MEIPTQVITHLAALPWRNNFCWLPDGHGGGVLLQRKATEDREAFWRYDFPADHHLTTEEFLSLPEGAPFELIQNKLYFMPAPQDIHQCIVHNLHGHLWAYLRKHKALGKLRFAPVDIKADERTVVQPDLLFVRMNRKALLTEKEVYGTPCFVVEVLSPGSTQHDLMTKYEHYEAGETEEYWIVHPKEKRVKQFVKKEAGTAFILNHLAEVLNERIHSQVIEGFEISLEEIFEDAGGETTG